MDPFCQRHAMGTTQGPEDLLLAIPLDAKSYLLFDQNAREYHQLPPIHLSIPSSFTSTDHPSFTIGENDTVSEIYKKLDQQNQDWFIKMQLIQALIPYQDYSSPLKPTGILQSSSVSCILIKGIFSTQPFLSEDRQYHLRLHLLFSLFIPWDSKKTSIWQKSSPYPTLPIERLSSAFPSL